MLKDIIQRFLFLISLAAASVTSATDNTELFVAIDGHDPQALKKAIQQGADVDAVRYNATALEWTLIENDLDSAKVLVEAGASYENMNKLMVQASNKPELISYLLSLGADPNMDSMGMSLLSSAASDNCLQCVKVLVAAGADPKKLDKKGRNALFWVPMSISPRNDGIAMTELLLSYGLDINYRDFSGMTLLAEAVEERKPDYVDYLISKGADPDVLDNERRPIAYYAWISHYPMTFLDIFPLSSLSKANQSSVMDFHLKNNNEDVVVYLLEHGVEISNPQAWLERKVGSSAALMYLILGNYPGLELDQVMTKVASEEKPRYIRALIRYGATANQLSGSDIIYMMENGLGKELFLAGLSTDHVIYEDEEYGEVVTLKDWAVESGYQDSLSVWENSLETVRKSEFLDIKLGTAETKLLKDKLVGRWLELEGDLTWAFEENGKVSRRMSFFGTSKEAKGRWGLTSSGIQVTWDEDGRNSYFLIADISESELVIEGRGTTSIYKKQ